jgi:multisubunit Na+/H+ antiporter MnhF subunit
MTLPATEYFLGSALMLFVAAIGFVRVARGPTLFDRIIGFDTIMIAIVGWLVLFSIHGNTVEYIELIIIVAALGFFATVCYVYYLSQSNPQDEGPDSETSP